MRLLPKFREDVVKKTNPEQWKLPSSGYPFAGWIIE